MGPDEPALPAAPPRFCPACGSPVQGDPPVCLPCAARSAAPHANTTVRAETAPLRHTLALYFSLLAVCGITILAGFGVDDLSPEWEVNADIIASSAFSLITVVAAILARRSILPSLAKTGPAHWYVAAPLIAVGTFALAMAALWALDLVIEIPSLEYTPIYLDAGYGWWLPILLVCVQPAVFEELAFRGVIGARLRRLLEPREAWLVTAALFATIHLSPVSFGHLLVVGLVLGYLRERSGSLYPGILLHFCHNGLCILSEYLTEAPL